MLYNLNELQNLKWSRQAQMVRDVLFRLRFGIRVIFVEYIFVVKLIILVVTVSAEGRVSAQSYLKMRLPFSMSRY